MTIEQRVEGLERSNRRLRAALACLVLIVSAVAVSGSFTVIPPGPVVATSVKVVDAKGKRWWNSSPSAMGEDE